MLLFASSLWYFGEGLFGPLFAIFSEKVGGDLLDITWAWSLYLIVTGVFYVLIGKLFNRSLWKSKLIAVGY
jgi:MFS family permease